MVCWKDTAGIRARTSARVAGWEWRRDRIADSREWIRALGLWVALRARREEVKTLEG
jgi:hypothetical protein